MDNLIIKGEFGNLIFSNPEIFDKNIEFEITGNNNKISSISKINFLIGDLTEKSDDTFNLLYSNEPNITLIFDDYDSDQFVKITKLDNMGHFEISAKIGASYTGNTAELKFETDSVTLNTFLDNLKNLLKANNIGFIYK